MTGTRFLIVISTISLVFSYLVWEFIFGAPDDRFGLHYIYAGGPLVVILMALLIVIVTLFLERLMALSAASGRRKSDVFLIPFLHAVENGEDGRAIQLCEEQTGVCATVLHRGMEQWRAGGDDSRRLTEETLEKATVAAVPALEQNLPSMSTIASISTMIGLLGTTIGMIRSFKALAQSGAPDAIQLSIGISEALINTAGGLLVAIIAIVGYNMCSQKVDRILQSTDDAAYRMMRLLRNRT